MRYLLFIIGIVVTATSCSSLKSTTKSRPVNNQATTTAPAPNKSNDNERLPIMPENRKTPKIVMIPRFNIEAGLPVQFKYAIKMDVEVEKLANESLYSFIESWWGTPYRMGGSTTKGVDCSAFTQTLLSVIYNISVPRTAGEQKLYCVPLQPENLKEGDLVFFITRGRNISHVGIYLQDNKFVHASTSSGVMISSLNENYWSKKYAGAGRVVDEKIAGVVTSKEIKNELHP